MTGHIHAAKLNDSPRLVRMLTVLADGGEHTTREISRACEIYAVGTTASELRANGIDVECRCVGRGRYAYSIPRHSLASAHGALSAAVLIRRMKK